MSPTPASSPPPPPRPFSRVFKALGVIAGILVVSIASGILFFMWSCTPPSLETLQRRFPKQRKDLEMILAMSNQDRHLLRIDPNWLLTDKYAQFENYDPAVGITEARWNEYRRLFDRNQIKQGIQRQPDSDDAFMRCIVRG